MRIRITPRVASAVVPAVGFIVFPRAPRVRFDSAAAADLLIFDNIRTRVIKGEEGGGEEGGREEGRRRR
jgi:hypothetical protein